MVPLEWILFRGSGLYSYNRPDIPRPPNEDSYLLPPSSSRTVVNTGKPWCAKATTPDGHQLVPSYLSG